jgi:hypothetical protein
MVSVMHKLILFLLLIPFVYAVDSNFTCPEGYARTTFFNNETNITTISCENTPCASDMILKDNVCQSKYQQDILIRIFSSNKKVFAVSALAILIVIWIFHDKSQKKAGEIREKIFKR